VIVEHSLLEDQAETMAANALNILKPSVNANHN
jgi:hypothetical protein